MKKLKFKKGDYCYFHYKKNLVEKTTEDGEHVLCVKSLDHGCNTYASANIFKNTEKIKLVSEKIENYYKKFKNNEIFEMNFGYMLYLRWAKMCKDINNEKMIEESFLEIDKYFNFFLEKNKEIEKIEKEIYSNMIEKI